MKESTPLACIVLAAGQGKRMKSDLAKVMHPLAGRPMVQWLLETVHELQPEQVVVVTAPGMEQVRTAVAPAGTAVQEIARGTGDAVKAALSELDGFRGDVLILLGDMPLIRAETLRDLRARRHHDSLTGLTVLGVELDPPPAFGRLVLDDRGGLEKIVEDRDCTPAERQIKLCNTGAFCVDGERLAGWVAKIGQNNAQGEFYITDLPQIAAQDAFHTHVHVVKDPDEVRGVNSRADLAALEAIVQDRLRLQAMENGATLQDPSTVYFSFDTKLGRDVTIEPNVWFGPGVTVGDGVHIKTCCRLEGVKIGSRSEIGPFAQLHPKTVIGDDCIIGNFVEVKRSTVGADVKAKHHAYIADATIGQGANFACGAITVNYDGVKKHKTLIGDNAMIGSNVNLVAPVTIGDSAYIAAGTTVVKDVPSDALAVGRIRPNIIEGWAAKRRK